MGARGPLPMPGFQLKARGSWRANRKTREPKTQSGRPARPAWLSDQGKKIWKQTIEILEGMNVLAMADRNAIARYCDNWDRWLKAREDVSLNGDTFTTDKGYEGRRPMSLLMDKLSDQIAKMEQQFGLTPASRPRLVAGVEQKNDGKPSKLEVLRE